MQCITVYRWKKKGEYLLFVGPILLLFLVFFLYPLGQSIFYSFTNWNGVGYTQWKGLSNYIYVLTKDTDFWNSFRFTVLFTLAYTVLTNTLSLLLARALTSGVRGENQLRILFFLPNVLSIVIVGIIWNFVFGQFFREMFLSTGWGFFDLPWLSDGNLAILSVAIAQSWAALGWFTLIYVSGYQAIPGHLYEAAAMDGCTGIRRYFRITLPLMMPSITICLFTTLTQGLQIFDLVFSMTSGGPGKMTQTVVMNIYDTSVGSMFYGFGSAKTVILSVVIMIVGFAQIRFTRSKEVEL